LPAAHFRPRVAVLKGLFFSSCKTVQCCQAITHGLAWDSVDGVHVGRSRGCMRNEVVYPGELPVGLNKLLSCGPRSLLVAHRRPGVESPHTCPPHRPTQAPSRGSSMQRGRGCPPDGPPWGSHAPVAWAPIHFRPLFAARF
jgi:hypothetical protein